MARVKPKRQGFHIDMTPMSDMAWLLLTFFILTTQFRKPEIVPITTPTSVSDMKLGDGNLVEISINKDGNYYFSIIDDKDKVPILEKMGQKYGLTFTDKEKQSFYNLSEVPVSIGQLKSFLNLEESQQKTQVPGIPLDSTNLQLMDWIDFSYEQNPEIKLAIKGDVDTQYPKFRTLLNELVNRDYNKFQLITSAEEKPR
ncbi:MAG: biopolymer transporter ExbD [Weeksellaceae bacterium]